MKEDIQKLHEKVEFLEVKAIEIGNSKVKHDSNNKEFKRKRIDMAKEKYSTRTNKENGLINVFFGTMFCNTFSTKEEAKQHIKDMNKRYKGIY